MKRAALFFFADLALKTWANFQPTEAWTGWAYVCHNTNTPITIWTFVSIGLFVVLTKRSGGGFWAWLMWAGVISNTLERLFFGRVTDMIPIPLELLFPVPSMAINLADLYITIPALILLTRLK
jgi:lipoprotein signal peptidase